MMAFLPGPLHLTPTETLFAGHLAQPTLTRLCYSVLAGGSWEPHSRLPLAIFIISRGFFGFRTRLTFCLHK